MRSKLLELYLPCAIILLMISGNIGKTAGIDAESALASSVEISFDDPNGFFLDLEAGEETTVDQLWFTARCVNANARITGLLIPPPTPVAMTWLWSFQPKNTQVITLNGISEFRARVKVHVKGNDIDIVPAGLYKGGSMIIIIDAL